MNRWYPYAAVGLGSALGSTLRYLVSAGSLAALGPLFPWGTLLVNVVGSWLIAWLATRGARYTRGRVARWQPFLVAGFCGGFTTFSLFGLETLHLVTVGRPGLALLYVVVSLPLWLGAALLGQRMARMGAAA
ncbi:CrcB family protein [Halomonas campisalis]|uniref:Fluoride-specific ion channel FluC n=1 Tax=Billgrantia campisalis TaxID=74661 RepID=A0ABS9PCU9_9GAMM|nr:CrcB family protein [Halomonas campisalis]MCG6659599.1 CrcB family protein [Halomonas campisalis]MDR5864560.1 CrcB family protein [Halomonas campisalis]